MRILTIPLAFLFMLLTGCAAYKTHEARDEQGGKLVGSNILDLVQSVGIPDKTMKLVDTGGPTDRMTAQWNFANSDSALDMTLILFGIPRLERLFSANEQLRSRACPARNFLPYDATDTDQMAAFGSCIVNYARLFSAAGYPIDVPVRVLRQQCYLLTGGLIGVLADFMRELASVMKNEAPRAITYADCQKAIESVNHAGSPHRLAFQDAGIDGASVEPAALKQAYVHVLTSNSASVPVRKKSGDK